MQSLDSFCFSIQTGPKTRKAHARGRSASATVPAAARPRTQQLWQGLTVTQSQQPAHPKQSEQIDDSSRDASANSRAERLHAPDDSADSRTDAQELAAADHGKPATTGLGEAPGQSQLQHAEAGSKPGSPEPGLSAESAEATRIRRRPGTAQAQVQSPGVFLRKARPQTAGAANVSKARKTKAAHLSVQSFNEPKGETGWVDFRAQNRMGARVSHLPIFVAWPVV